jgi:hypothetical protein
VGKVGEAKGDQRGRKRIWNTIARGRKGQSKRLEENLEYKSIGARGFTVSKAARGRDNR